MNGDFPAPLLAFDEHDELFVNSQWMAFSNKGWPVNRGDRRRCGDRQFPREASSGA
jgi:hypothetical protein